MGTGSNSGAWTGDGGIQRGANRTCLDPPEVPLVIRKLTSRPS